MATEIITVAADTAVHSKLRDFFIDQLQDISWAEKKLVKALEKMKAEATTVRINECFNDHLKETKQHVDLLKDIFAFLNESDEEKQADEMLTYIAEHGINYAASQEPEE